MMSATHYFGDIDVICDIGGRTSRSCHAERRHQEFRLSNSVLGGQRHAPAGDADQFGVAVTKYADVAFERSCRRSFSYGCAVFLDSDPVNFQKEGYSRRAAGGLAQVLPKNVWQYVVQIPRMAELGRKFVLQGGTQHNLAALKAQVDYIKARVHPSLRAPATPASGRSARRWRRAAWSCVAVTRRSSRRQRHQPHLHVEE